MHSELQTVTEHIQTHTKTAKTFSIPYNMYQLWALRMIMQFWLNINVEKLNLWKCTSSQLVVSCYPWKNLNRKITNFEKAFFLRNARAGEHFDSVSASMVHRIDDDFSLVCCGNTLIWRFCGCNLVTRYDRWSTVTSKSTTFLLRPHIGTSYENKRQSIICVCAAGKLVHTTQRYNPHTILHDMCQYHVKICFKCHSSHLI